MLLTIYISFWPIYKMLLNKKYIILLKHNYYCLLYKFALTNVYSIIVTKKELKLLSTKYKNGS
jgi:hypothetical protein